MEDRTGGKMLGKFGKIGWMIILAIGLLLTACAPKVVMPTQDINLVRTEAVQTALAQVTREAALAPAPSATPMPATITPLAGTPVVVVVTATSPIYSGGSSSGGGSYSAVTPIPTWTPVIYKAQFITQNYLDGYPCLTGNDIDFIVTLKNIGAATWDKTYYYKVLWETVKIATQPQGYFLEKNVLTGEQIKLTMDIKCPTVPGGPWTSQWGLVNDNGEVFARFYFKFFTVLHPPTPTPTATRTPSPG